MDYWTSGSHKLCPLLLRMYEDHYHGFIEVPSQTENCLSVCFSKWVANVIWLSRTRHLFSLNVLFHSCKIGSSQRECSLRYQRKILVLLSCKSGNLLKSVWHQNIAYTYGYLFSQELLKHIIYVCVCDGILYVTTVNGHTMIHGGRKSETHSF